jgi:hypothetical protein
MHTGNDPLERVAQADPLPEAERLTPDEQREAETLLASVLAEPVEPRRRPLSPRPWVAAAAAGCALVLVLVAGGLFDDDTSGADVIARAVAAVSEDDAIFHIVERTTLRSPRGGRDSALKEAWYAPDGSAHEKYFEVRDGRRGPLVGETAGVLPSSPSGRRGGPVDIYNARTNEILRTRWSTTRIPAAPTLDPGGDPGARLRELERSGDLRLAGTSELDGRDAYRLVSGPVRGFDPGSVDRYEYLVDAETYQPLSLRLVSRTDGRALEMATRFLVYESIPFDARAKRLLDLDPHPGARVRYGAGREPSGRDRGGR